VTEM